jgi:eukaryotic-like serine/threonine-protein kinase
VSPNKLGRYDLVRVLGKGAMGVVYEARDPNLDRRVAIKTVKVENLSEEAADEYESRFRTEARSAARLQHPNIVSVYDSDRDGDIAFLVMEFIQGDDLKRYLDKGIRYSLEQSLKMVRDLLSALDYAHKQGIVHRDIKPANLLIEPGGRVKLTDFGVARIQNSGEATRTQGSMVGTLKYMSPEQVQGLKIDSRADLFSVGVVLYQLLTDKRPFDGDNDFSIIHQIIGHTPAPPSSFNSKLPSAIDAVVARALAKDRDERFASARDFATALQSATRRAEDATIVPPADPFKKMDSAGTASMGHRSMTNSGSSQPAINGSTITQEVELVYWKDIKESTDPEELQGFLEKFPAGIYADLARRRLRKLSLGAAFDQTVLSGANTLPGMKELEATFQLPSVSLPNPVAARQDDDTTPPTAEAPPDDLAHTIVQPLVPVPTASSSADVTGPDNPPPADSAAVEVTEPAPLPALDPAPDPVPLTAPRPRRPLIAVLSGLGALAAAGLVAFMMMDKGAGDIASSQAPAISRSSAEPGVEVVRIVPTVGPGPVPNASAAAVTPAPPTPRVTSAAAETPAATGAAGTPAAGRTARRAAIDARVQSAPPPPVIDSHPEEPPPRREERRTVAVAPSAPAAPNPAEQCKDKVFLSKEFCLAEQCEKPGARNHPLCVKRREEAKLREESKVRY